MITVMGATGRVGRRIVAALAPGERVRAVSRSPQRPVGHGVDPYVGDAADAAFLTGAFRGADAAFTMLPVDAHEPDQRPPRTRRARRSPPRCASRACPTW